MASKFQMQAQSSADGRLYSWLSVTPDWTAAGYAAAGFPGSAQDVTLTGGGLDTTGGASLFQVTAAGVGVTAGGAEVDATPIVNLVTAGGVQVTASNVNVAA
jgi:hypothetical protein